MFTLDIERRLEQALPPRLRSLWGRLDALAAGLMRRHGITLLRLALGVVFVWFGTLKVIGESPVEGLVAETVYWLPEEEFVRFLGVWEIAVGVGLLVPVALRLTLLLFWAQMAGTLLVFVVNPDVAFEGNNPFLLTTEGEFVVKNLVLITAGLAIGSTVRRGADARAERTLARAGPGVR